MNIPTNILQLVSKTSILLLLAVVWGLTGCLSRPALKEQTFTFNVPPATATNVVTHKHVLGIRSLKIAAPFDGRSFVYRTGEYSYERDPYAAFLEPPADDLMEPMRQLLRTKRSFSAVLDTGSIVRPEVLVEINITQLYGDLRKPEQPAAVMAVHFVFLDAPKGIPATLIFQKEYARSILLNRPSAASLMTGWNQALKEILAELTNDLDQSASDP
jgi:cholesterol transport system auxiliary component